MRDEARFIRGGRSGQPGRPARRFPSTGETAAEAARRLGIKPESLYARLSRGQSEQAALSTPKEGKAKRFDFDGKSLTIKEWVAALPELCLTAEALYGRFYSDWSIADALTIPKGASRFPCPYRKGLRDVPRREKRKGKLWVGWCSRCGTGHVFWHPGKPPVCNVCGWVKQ